MRSKFVVEGQTVIHTGIDPWTKQQFVRRYWIPAAGGYVRLDTTRDGSRPGTLGTQPTDDDGRTWRVSNLALLLWLVKREWRREVAAYKRA